MARIKCTMTTYSCPHCGRVLKQEGDTTLLWIFLMIFTMFIPLFWIIGNCILNAIFKYDSVELGSPFIICPRCGNKVKMGKKNEWGLLTKVEKLDWAFRNKMKVCYVLGGTSLFCLIIPLFGAWQSSHQTDRTIAIVMLIIAILSIGIIGFIYYLRNKTYCLDYIIVSESDYSLIQESWNRLHKIEPLLTETETIKISTTGEIIRPQIKNEQVIQKNNIIEINETNKEGNIIKKLNNENKNKIIETKIEEKTKNSNKKRIIIIKKKK